MSKKCPECGKEIKLARCFGQCAQDCTVDESGKVLEFGQLEALSGDEIFECKNCGVDITDLLKFDDRGTDD